MPSSTSSFKQQPVAEPVTPTRSASAPGIGTLLLAGALLLVLLAGWELRMRELGLRAGDLDDGRDDWVQERRKVDTGPRDQVVIVGDSRILFDTDLATWERVAGRRPIQLALPAANPQPFLHDLAQDEHFAGLLVLGTAENSYFRNSGASDDPTLDYVTRQTPSQWLGHEIKKAASGQLAFLDSNYTLFTLLEQVHWPERRDVDGAYKDVWKLSESGTARQTWLWDRIESDAALREHAREVWKSVYRAVEVKPAVVERVIAAAKADVARIRARGGEVVWVRPPSSGLVLERERQRFPRAKVWDRLLRETGTVGVYFDDYPAMRALEAPDWSHLARGAAPVFTEAYVQALLERVAWLRRRSTAAASMPHVTPPEPSLTRAPAPTPRNRS